MTDKGIVVSADLGTGAAGIGGSGCLKAGIAPAGAVRGSAGGPTAGAGEGVAMASGVGGAILAGGDVSTDCADSNGERVAANDVDEALSEGFGKGEDAVTMGTGDGVIGIGGGGKAIAPSGEGSEAGETTGPPTGVGLCAASTVCAAARLTIAPGADSVASWWGRGGREGTGGAVIRAGKAGGASF